jgi:hypothetical protein
MTKQINGDKLFVIDHHPAIPPSDQLKKWEDQWFNEEEHADVLLIQAFQAGADHELEACIDWISIYTGLEHPELLIELLRASRRPKPPSLSRVALLQLDVLSADLGINGAPVDLSQIRRALERLQELESNE